MRRRNQSDPTSREAAPSDCPPHSRATQYGPGYGRIVNRAHLDRLTGMQADQHVAIGGTFDAESLYFAPTVVDGVSWDSPLIRDEIFGPILPVLGYDDLSEELLRLSARPSRSPSTCSLAITPRSDSPRRFRRASSCAGAVSRDFWACAGRLIGCRCG